MWDLVPSRNYLMMFGRDSDFFTSRLDSLGSLYSDVSWNVGFFDVQTSELHFWHLDFCSCVHSKNFKHFHLKPFPSKIQMFFCKFVPKLVFSERWFYLVVLPVKKYCFWTLGQVWSLRFVVQMSKSKGDVCRQRRVWTLHCFCPQRWKCAKVCLLPWTRCAFFKSLVGFFCWLFLRKLCCSSKKKSREKHKLDTPWHYQLFQMGKWSCLSLGWGH